MIYYFVFTLYPFNISMKIFVFFVDFVFSKCSQVASAFDSKNLSLFICLQFQCPLMLCVPFLHLSGFCPELLLAIIHTRQGPNRPSEKLYKSKPVSVLIIYFYGPLVRHWTILEQIQWLRWELLGPNRRRLSKPTTWPMNRNIAFRCYPR